MTIKNKFLYLRLNRVGREMPTEKKSVSLSSREIKSPIFDMREWKLSRSSYLYVALSRDHYTNLWGHFLLFFSHVGRLAMPISSEESKEVPTFLLS